MFFKFFQEYSETTTIHGIRYVLEKGSSYFERFLWLIIVLCGIGLAILISILAYIQWKENPVLTSISTTGYPIEKVPFPAITICAQVMKYYCVVAEFEKYFLLAKFRGLDENIVRTTLQKTVFVVTQSPSKESARTALLHSCLSQITK